MYIAITLLLLLPPSRKDFISEVITVTSQFCKRQCFPYTSNFPSPYHSSVFLYVLVPYNKFTLSQLIVDIPSNHSNALSETSTSTWRKPNVLTFWIFSHTLFSKPFLVRLFSLMQGTFNQEYKHEKIAFCFSVLHILVSSNQHCFMFDTPDSGYLTYLNLDTKLSTHMPHICYISWFCIFWRYSLWVRQIDKA